MLALAAAARGQVDFVVTNAQNASSSIPAMAAPMLDSASMRKVAEETTTWPSLKPERICT